MKIHNEDIFIKHVLAEYPRESVGYVQNNIYCPLENVHSDPLNFFSLSAKDSELLATIEDYVLIHSHTEETFTADPRTPSYEDMLGQRDTGVTWGIVHCDGENVSKILYFGPPSKEALLGRNYISNVQDCFTLARDFLYIEKGIDVGIHPRPTEWEVWNPHYIEQTYTSLGFKQVPVDDVQCGDILLFTIGSKYINHIGVYVGEDVFIHHLYNRTSASDSFRKWHKQLTKVIRL
jgi:proteasome lid subunit RPN8/RPN11